MSIINSVTKLYLSEGLTEETIQAHLDTQNELGYYLVAVDHISGWYRFFWAKQVEA
jgi:hypothetical protein